MSEAGERNKKKTQMAKSLEKIEMEKNGPTVRDAFFAVFNEPTELPNLAARNLHLLSSILYSTPIFSRQTGRESALGFTMDGYCL